MRMSPTPRSTSPRPARSRTPAPRHTLLLGLLFAAACGSSETATSPGSPAAAGPGAADPGNETEALAARRRPPVMDYTQAELEALAQTPEIAALLEPWAPPPAPDRSFHVTVSDGTRLALSLYFPAGFDQTNGKAPIAYVETWYGRRMEANGHAIDRYRAAGFVVAISDPRGFGSSFGTQTSFLTDDVRRDQKEMIAWLASQSWSTGQVVAVGISISSTQAEAMAASGAPALKGAIVRASDFDHYNNNLFPGGLSNTRMLNLVADVTAMTRGEPCLADPAVCPQWPLAPVDGDTDYSLLRAAFQEHQTNFRGEMLSSMVYRDDAIGTGTIDGVSPVAWTDALRRAAVPARVPASWMDGTTAESALARFNALPDVPMQVAISSSIHMGGLDADPFSRQPFQVARPQAAEQFGDDIAFLKKVLGGEAPNREVSYYVLGAGVWKSTPVWPPAGVKNQTLHLSGAALTDRPVIRSGSIDYQVDPTTSSGGNFNRWSSQSGGPVYYGDRRAAPGQRLSFDSEPVTCDTELVGAAELCLAMSSDQPDGAVIAYLEDVAPDGRVTYLTEGELRLLHRKVAGSSDGCDAAPGTQRSFNRADGAPAVPGARMRVELSLLPTAARIERGHRVRLSLAGADAGTFPMPTPVAPRWTVATGGRDGSTLTIPVRTWSPR